MVELVNLEGSPNILGRALFTIVFAFLGLFFLSAIVVQILRNFSHIL